MRYVERNEGGHGGGWFKGIGSAGTGADKIVMVGMGRSGTFRPYRGDSRMGE